MKLLTILGSPHREIGSTNQIAKWIAERFHNAGWETEIIHLSDKRINYCAGCAMCLMKGNCPQIDDIPEIHQHMNEADAIIFGSPVYILNVTAQMKTFLDRCLPYGHRPSLQGKYGAAITVFAGVGNAKDVAKYLTNIMTHFGITTVGSISAFATRPGELKEGTKKRAIELADKIIDAAEGRVEYPEPKPNPQMKRLVLYNKDFFRADYQYWVEKGWMV